MNTHSLVRPICIIAAAISAFPGAVNAQGQRPVLEEVIVVAQKREQSLQDVPISLAVMDSGMLATRGIDNLTDIGANVPNLVVNPVNNTPTSVRMFVRGIGQNDVQLTQDPSVALYMDGVYIGTSIGAGFDGVDVQHIEILRGPQGTLYGRNASGGAVNIVTRRADPGELEFRQELTAGNLDLFKSKTVLIVPLNDRAAIKLNYFHNEQGEVTENKGPGEHFGMRNNDSLVADLRWDVSDAFSVDYRYEKAWIETSQRFEQTVATAPAPLGAFTDITQASTGRLDDVVSAREIVDNELDIDGHSLTLAWDITDALILKSITAYRDFDNEYFSDPLSTSVGDYTALGRGAGAPSYAVSTTTFEQFSQEIQLLGSTDTLEYVAGLYYYEDDSELDADGSMTLAALNPTDYTSAENESRAIFGQFTWNPAFMDQRWQITVGARYAEDDRKAFRDNQIAGFSGDYDENFSNFTPALTVGFDLGDDMNIYGKVVTGFRSGGTSQRSANAILFAQGFDEEEIVSYEIGFKGDFWDTRARFNAALFHMELDGLQISAQTGSTPGQRDYLPIDDNTIDGLELDLTLMITERLRLRLDYGYLDAEFGQDSVDSPAGTYYFTDTFAYAPENTFTASLDYHFPLKNGDLDINLNYAYRDETHTEIDREQSVGIDDYGLWGGAITWSEISLGEGIPGTLKLMLWGKNLGDEEYALISVGAWSIFGASEVTTFGDPRTYGLTLSYQY